MLRDVQFAPGQVPATVAGGSWDMSVKGNPLQWKRLGKEPAHSSDWAVNPRAGVPEGDKRGGKGEDSGTGGGCTLG